MELKKGRKNSHEFDYVILNNGVVCVQIACLPGKFININKKILEKHLKNAIKEIINNHAK